MEFNGVEIIKDVPTGDFRESKKLQVKEYTDVILRYVQSHPKYNEWDIERVVLEVINVMAQDIGAAQSFLNLIGVKVDLFTTDFEKENEDGKQINRDQ